MSRKQIYLAFLVSVLGFVLAAAGAGWAVPYTVDSHTLHLYHFDGDGKDSVTVNPIDLVLDSGATASDAKLPGLGQALYTYEGTNRTNVNLPSAMATTSLAISNFVGADGAFTFEALVCPAFGPGSIPNNMQIISGEHNSTRGWQFRVTTAGELAFINLTGTIQTIAIPLPKSGPHAYAADKWFHAAVTYNGQANTDENLKFYWTALDTGVCDPVLLGAARMNANLIPTVTPNFVIGNEGRETNGRTENWEGWIDEVRISDIARSPSDMAPCVDTSSARMPSPADRATDVPPEGVVLAWTPGEYAATHDVYLGTIFADVNNASRTNPRGVLASQGQVAAIYDPPGRLDFGQTYYWRIDEVNAPPTSTIYKGKTWSFTVEPIAYPIDGTSVTAIASSSNSPAEDLANTINGSGLDANELHSTENTEMWLSSMTGAQPTWIQYDFDRAYRLHQMRVWNYNGLIEPAIGFGIKEATIEYSTDGAAWSTLGTTHEFARGPGSAGYAANTTIDLGGAAAKYLRITANSNWGGILPQYGLSEVRFFSIPVLAREPDPASGATDMGPDVTLDWRAGREAVKHNVYLSTDEQAVIDGTAPVATATSPTYSTSLDLASTYYWRVDEVNEAETPASWQGDVWSFSTQEYLVVDDFESYNDIASGEEGSHLVYETWADGYANPSTNGSTIGYTEAFQPSMDTTTVYDGKQSVPLFYNNTTASISEVTANVPNLLAGKDWTRYGIKGLTLRFYGDPANTSQQLYVKVNGKKASYDGSTENLKRPGWQMWYIDLASLGVNLSNVTTLTIGLERIGTVGGQGMILLDGLRLYSYDRQLITPIDPGTANLQAQYQFEGNANDSSGKGRNGTAMGGPLFVAGKVGQAISLDGTDDYVTITGYKGILADASGVQQPFTIAAWVKTTDSGDRTIASWGTNTNMLRVDFRLFEGRLRVEHGGGNMQGDTTLNDDNWHHVALTMVQGATVSYPDVQLWLDGRDNTRPSADADAFSITAGVDMAIGYRATAAARYFLGAIDDVRLYDRALPPEEVAGLAGLTKPFDKPF